MSAKLLQKSSNKFLQQSLPENLIANKGLGKKQAQKYGEKPSFHRKTVWDKAQEMERQCAGHWAMFWERLREKELENTGKRKPLKFCVFHVSRVGDGKPGLEGKRKTLLFPEIDLLKNRINRALGGKIIDYLNQQVKNVPDQLLATALRPVCQGIHSAVPVPEMLGGCKVGGGLEKPWQEGGKVKSILLATPFALFQKKKFTWLFFCCKK